VAHGFLTLSMLPALIEGAVRFDGVQMSLNYGLNRVRFVSPVRVNSRLRLRLKLLEATPLDSGMQTTLEAILEIEGVLKPACVAEIVIRLLR
jgi:acyl dehydratase